MDRIKFGTDGWRGVIAHQFTVANVAKISSAVAIWLMNKYKDPVVIVGYDTRFQGRLFAETTAKVLASKGIKVRLSDDFVSTPMLSLAVREWEASLGIMITASHNNFSYNGYKLKGDYGGPLMSDELKNIEDLLTDENNLDLDMLKWDQYVSQGLISYADLEAHYVKFVGSYFDLEAIAGSGLKIGFEAMYGSAQKVFGKLLPGAELFHCEADPLFGGIPPEPLEKNLQELIARMQKGKLNLAIAVDGDGDRIALVNRKGEYIDSHTIILILIHLMAGYRKAGGKVVTGFSSTSRVEKLSKHYELDVIRVPIGFKDICRVMLSEEVMVGGEESGGISVSGYLPERDGIWMGLTILQILADTGKSLEEILDEIYRITGPFACLRRDIPIPRDKRNKVMDLCYNGDIDSFGEFRVSRTEALDGVKFYFSEDEWLMVRGSGTEPLLRTYAEASDSAKADKILEAAGRVIAEMAR